MRKRLSIYLMAFPETPELAAAAVAGEVVDVREFAGAEVTLGR